MTPARYPLIAFFGAERYVKGSLIDPRTEDDDLPTEVNVVTKARKCKERMEAWGKGQYKGEDSNDRRCLIGVRKLEDGDGYESRMKRLLDGPIDGRLPAMLPGRGDGTTDRVHPHKQRDGGVTDWH
jgi:serine/threonine-protein kinase/endoribonuclease IRE1